MKPLKKKMQIALGGKRMKRNASKSSSKKRTKYPVDSNDYVLKKLRSPTDSLAQDSVITEKPSGGSLALMDTVIKIYYLNLNDSILNNYKKIIKSYVSRTGKTHISEVALTDIYSSEGFTDKSIKSDIGKYLVEVGVSKHKLFWRRNERVKKSEMRHNDKRLLYLEIRFH